MKGWETNFTTFDIKNFYSEVQKQHLKPRLLFILKSFQNNNKTNYVSVPKSKSDKTMKPHPGKNRSADYITFKARDVIDICEFASDFAFFNLGKIVLKQISGLPTGCPMSGPAAFSYVSFDEHFARTTHFIRTITPEYHIATCRFADDVFLALLVPEQHAKETFRKVCDFYMNDIYERDLPEKNLIIKIDNDSNKYLDSDVITYAGKTRVKITYHNKNREIVNTDNQEVGRFHDDC